MIASEPVNHHRRKAAGALVGVGVLLCGAVALSGRQHSASIIRVPDEKFELFGYEISFSMLPDLYAGFTKAVPVTLGNLIHSKQEEIAAARGIFDKNGEYNGGSVGDGSWVDAMKECQKAHSKEDCAAAAESTGDRLDASTGAMVDAAGNAIDSFNDYKNDKQEAGEGYVMDGQILDCAKAENKMKCMGGWAKDKTGQWVGPGGIFDQAGFFGR